MSSVSMKAGYFRGQTLTMIVSTNGMFSLLKVMSWELFLIGNADKIIDSKRQNFEPFRMLALMLNQILSHLY